MSCSLIFVTTLLSWKEPINLFIWIKKTSLVWPPFRVLCTSIKWINNSVKLHQKKLTPLSKTMRGKLSYSPNIVHLMNMWKSPKKTNYTMVSEIETWAPVLSLETIQRRHCTIFGNLIMIQSSDYRTNCSTHAQPSPLYGEPGTTREDIFLCLQFTE